MESNFIFEYKEKIELTLKAIFILKEMMSFPDKEMNTSDRYDYLRSSYQHYDKGQYASCEERNKAESMHSDFYLLCKLDLIESIDVGEGCYFRYKVSKKGEYIYPQVKDIDTSLLNFHKERHANRYK